MLLRVPPLALESQPLQQHRKQTWPWILEEVSRVLRYLKLPAWNEGIKTQGFKETRWRPKMAVATGSYPVKVTWRMKIPERERRGNSVTSVQALYRLPSTHGFFTVDTVSLHFDQWIRPVPWSSSLPIPSHQIKWWTGIVFLLWRIWFSVASICRAVVRQWCRFRASLTTTSSSLKLNQNPKCEMCLPEYLLAQTEIKSIRNS